MFNIGLSTGLNGWTQWKQTDIVRAIFRDTSPGLSILIEEAVKANEAALGPELVVNGDFSNGLTSWQFANGGWSWEGGKAKLTSDGSLQEIYQTILTFGKAYVASFEVQSDSAAIVLSSNAGNIVSTAAGKATAFFIADKPHFAFKRLSGSPVATLDNVSLKEIDLSKCQAFQDAQGTVPVVAMEQPIGLLLDSSLGLVRGPVLPLSNSVSWADNGNGTLTRSTASWAAIQSYSSGIKAGDWVEASFTVVSGSGNIGFFRRNANNLVNETLLHAPAVVGKEYRMVAQAVLDNATTTVWIDGDSFIGTITTPVIRRLPGNHLVQPSNTASRPIVSRRVNVSANTENLAGATWTASGVAVSSGTSACPATGRTGSTVSSLNTASNGVYQSNTVIAGAAYEFTAFRKLGTMAPADAKIAFYDVTQSAFVSKEVMPTIEELADGWQKITHSVTAPVGCTSLRVYPFRSDAAVAGTLEIGGVDLRLATDANGTMPSYQAVRSATDYDQVGFPAYAQFDGLDDWLETGAIDMAGTDAVAVVASMTKLSDSVEQMLAEFSGSSGTIDGAFALWANIATGSGIRFRSRGTSNADLAPSPPFPAGTKVILGGVGNITAPSISVRSNGVELASSGASQGTGNYGNHKLYVGRRNGATVPFKGRIYGLTVVGKLLSDSQLLALEAKHRNTGKVY